MDRLWSDDFTHPIVPNGPCTKQETNESVSEGHGIEGSVISWTTQAMGVGQLGRSLCEDRPRGFGLEGLVIRTEMNEIVKLLRGDQLYRNR